MQHDLFNAGRRHSKSEVLECNCQLKVGSQYLLFIVAAKDSTYIRAAYEVLPGDSAEARFAAKGEPIVLITDTDRLGTNYLLLSGKFPTSYQEKVVTSMDNVSHEFPTNAWYLLKDVQDEINGYMAEHPRK